MLTAPNRNYDGKTGAYPSSERTCLWVGPTRECVLAAVGLGIALSLPAQLSPHRERQSPVDQALLPHLPLPVRHLQLVGYRLILRIPARQPLLQVPGRLQLRHRLR